MRLARWVVRTAPSRSCYLISSTHSTALLHIQIAGMPDRHEPDEQNELNYPFLFRLLGTELGWGGFVGCEYNPRGGTDSGLGWLERSGLMVK
ncbi:hypothetical protein T492DRAFT_1149512, partial [Pavlovales sp. CCMP2436]